MARDTEPSKCPTRFSAVAALFKAHQAIERSLLSAVRRYSRGHAGVLSPLADGAAECFEELILAGRAWGKRRLFNGLKRNL